MAQIAKECGVSSDTIRRHMIRNNIEYWTTQYRAPFTERQKDIMQALYTENLLSANQISSIFGCSHATVRRILRSRGIKIRNISESQFTRLGKPINALYNDREWWYTMYWIENKTTTEIAQVLGIQPSTVLRHLSVLNIKTKTVSEAKQGAMVGERHPNWQGGKTPLKKLLREFFAVNQLPVVAKRDNYTCQLCGATHTILNVHHIRGFAEIVDEIVAEHPEYNPDDPMARVQLYDIITHDERFLDTNNLITLCKKCHYCKIHNLKRDKTISSQAHYSWEGSETIPQGSTP